MKARGQTVELFEPGSQAGDGVGIVKQFVYVGEGIFHQGRHALERVAPFGAGEFEDARLGSVEYLFDRAGLIVGDLHDVAAGRDEVSESSLLEDDPGVVLSVRCGRHAVREPDEIGNAADGLELPRLPQLLGEGDQVDRLAPLGETIHGPEDLAMPLLVEVVGADSAFYSSEHFVIEQDAPKNALLSLEVLRGGASFHAYYCTRPLIRDRTGPPGSGAASQIGLM